MFGPFFQLLKAVASQAGPWQIAWAVSLGMVLGLTPFWIHSLVVLLLLMVLRVNFASAMASWALFGLLSLALNPASHALGEWWLTHPDWQAFWTTLYQNRVWQLMHFHHTLTLGSLAISVLLMVPVAIATRQAIPPFRKHVVPVLQRYHIVRAAKANTWYGRFVNAWRRF